MEPMSRTERAALCNTALEAGENAPTLCGDWTVKDLVIHLLIRERDLVAAPGILVPRLGFLVDRATRRMRDQDFTALVERVRGGPPMWSPMKAPPVDRVLNTIEFFVHHEDIRRGAPGWEPRELTEREQRLVFKGASAAGKALVRAVGTPVEIRWYDGERERSTTLVGGDDPVVVTGEPAELTMFLFGRDQHRGLTFVGPQERIDALTSASLGF